MSKIILNSIVQWGYFLLNVYSTQRRGKTVEYTLRKNNAI